MPRRLQEAGIEGAERQPIILGSDWGSKHRYRSSEQLLTEATNGMTDWIQKGLGGRTESVTQALRHAKWKIYADEVQGSSKLTTIRVQPSQWLLTL